jgi:hypothetical protein
MAPDGRYRGGGHQLDVELRIDRRGARIVSADLFRRSESRPSWLASLRTSPDTTSLEVLELLPIIAQDRAQRIATGSLDLLPISDNGEELAGTLRLDAPLEGLPAGRAIRFDIAFESVALRRLGIEIEVETGVAPPPEITFEDEPMSIRVALAKAGIETYAAGFSSRLPSAPLQLDEEAGWSEKDLEGLMRDFAETSLDRPGFELRLLWLSKSNRPGLLGIMFDSEDASQRQGVAVFAEEIRARLPAPHSDRKLIQTTVHEIGHALNLVHCFERAVGKANSTSFMNYDWRYKGGRQAAEFWNGFCYAFDPGELAFLCHGPLPAVIPGGAAFHSAPYWAEGGGGYAPHTPEAPLPGFELELVPPTAGRVFLFGQPVLLGVRLTNRTRRRLLLPSFLLDQKAGLLEVIVRRIEAVDEPGGELQSFVPILTRCYDLIEDTTSTLEPGKTMEDNVNLTFGAAGFAFAEPGSYEVTALLTLYDTPTERELIAASPPLRIRIAHPRSIEEEHDALVLFRTDVGRYFALGGSGAAQFDPTKSMLDELLERRLRSGRVRAAKRAIDLAPHDPVAANIVRCKGLRAARVHHAYVDGKVVVRKPAEPTKALAHLERLDERSLAVFDRVTACTTVAYRKRLAVEAS